MNTYRIGKATDPREDDPTFATWQPALSAALAMSNADALDSFVIAIWEEDGFGRIAALVYEGSVYTP